MDSPRTLLHPEKFAFGFAQVFCNNQNGDDAVTSSKIYLGAYLTAYYLAQSFNEIESKNFNSVNETKFRDMSFESLMTTINKLNKY